MRFTASVSSPWGKIMTLRTWCIVFVPAVQLEISQVWSHEEAQEWLLEDHVLRPLESFGLVEIVRGETKPGRFHSSHRVRRLPLFDDFIRFDV